MPGVRANRKTRREPPSEALKPQTRSHKRARTTWQETATLSCGSAPTPAWLVCVCSRMRPVAFIYMYMYVCIYIYIYIYISCCTKYAPAVDCHVQSMILLTLTYYRVLLGCDTLLPARTKCPATGSTWGGRPRRSSWQARAVSRSARRRCICEQY